MPLRVTVTALLTAALAVAAAGTASADTNKSEQTSARSGPTAPLLSPAIVAVAPVGPVP